MLQLLACYCSIRAISSFHSSGAAFCTHLAKVDISSTTISASGLNVPSLTPDLPTVRSSVYIHTASVILPTVRMSSETHISYSTTSSRWYIASDSAFAYTKHVILYFLVGSVVTKWYIKSLINH